MGIILIPFKLSFKAAAYVFAGMLAALGAVIYVVGSLVVLLSKFVGILIALAATGVLFAGIFGMFSAIEMWWFAPISGYIAAAVMIFAPMLVKLFGELLIRAFHGICGGLSDISVLPN